MRPCAFDNCERAHRADTLGQQVNELILRNSQLEQALAIVQAENAELRQAVTTLRIRLHRIDAINGEIISRQARELARARVQAGYQWWAIVDDRNPPSTGNPPFSVTGIDGLVEWTPPDSTSWENSGDDLARWAG